MKDFAKEILLPAFVIITFMFLLFWGGAWLISMVPWLAGFTGTAS